MLQMALAAISPWEIGITPNTYLRIAMLACFISAGISISRDVRDYHDQNKPNENEIQLGVTIYSDPN